MLENKKVIVIPYLVLLLAISILIYKYFQSNQASLGDYGVSLFFIAFGAQIVFSYHYGKEIYIAPGIIGSEEEEGKRLFVAIIGYVIMVVAPFFA